MEERFWNMGGVSSENEVFGPCTCGLVDGEADGVIAYVEDYETCEMLVNLLNKKEVV